MKMKRQRLMMQSSSCFLLLSSIHSSAFTSTSTNQYFHHISHRVLHVQKASPYYFSSKVDNDSSVSDNNILVQRRIFLSQISIAASAFFTFPSNATVETSSTQPSDAIISAAETPFHTAAYGQEEYTNSIVASRDTNISPREVYDTIASDYLKSVLEVVLKTGGDPRALDVGAGAGVSTEVLYRLGYHRIDALDWSGTAWQRYVIDDPSGYCPPSVKFYELDDERYLDLWRTKFSSTSHETSASDGNGLFDVIVFNFAVNESKAKLFATQLLNKNHGILLAPINTMNDYWLKQNYKIINSEGTVLWSTADVGAWSVQFQPDVTQDTCSGVWCAPFNGFQKKK
eukprot:CCRYP_005816-RA/>CCRYP_005816-RA protein AED:0.37 eAED:0.37 QI:0/0/0/1/1/1/2/0/341